MLGWAAASLLWFLRGNPFGLRALRRSDEPASRRRAYWLAGGRLWLAFGLPALAWLVLLGRADALVRLPVEFAALAARLPPFDPGSFAILAMGGAVLGVPLGLVLRPRATAGRWHPRAAGELLPAAWLALSAGITEELFFRLGLPLLIAQVITPEWGFAIALLIFARLHLYRGVVGAAAALGIGLVLIALYLGSGQLWLAIVLHGAVNASALVVRPALTGFRRGRGGPGD